MFFFFFTSRRRHTRLQGDWSSDVCSSDLERGYFSLANQGQVLQTAFAVGNGHFRVSLQEGDDRIAFAGLQQRGLERGRETPVYGPRPHVSNGVAQRSEEH